MSASTYKRRSCGDGGADRPLTRASFHTSLRLPGYAKTKTISPVVRKKKRPNIPGGRYFMIYSMYNPWGSTFCAEQSMDCLDPYFAHGTMRAQSTDYCAICGSIDCAGQSTLCDMMLECLTVAHAQIDEELTSADQDYFTLHTDNQIW